MSGMLEKYNIRDTKQYYSEINEKALKGLEVITYNASRRTFEVSHIRTDILDAIMEKYVIFKPEEEFDSELGIWTISLNEIDMYGEGSTKEEAIDDLINSIIEFTDIYLKKIDLFSLTESVEKKTFMRKIMRCENDKEKIRKATGL